VEQITSHFWVDNSTVHAHRDASTTLFIRLFLFRLVRYLNTPGHPAHNTFTNPECPQFVSARDIQGEADNALLRAKLLILAMTDHEFVPLDERWAMTVGHHFESSWFYISHIPL
jgi:hypothetical protein